MKLVARECWVPAWSWGDPEERWKLGCALAAGRLVEERESHRIWPVTDGQRLVRTQWTQPVAPVRWQLPHHRGAHPAPGPALPPQLLLQLLAVAWPWQPWAGNHSMAVVGSGCEPGLSLRPQAGVCDRGSHSISARKVWILW